MYETINGLSCLPYSSSSSRIIRVTCAGAGTWAGGGCPAAFCFPFFTLLAIGSVVYREDSLRVWKGEREVRMTTDTRPKSTRRKKVKFKRQRYYKDSVAGRASAVASPLLGRPSDRGRGRFWWAHPPLQSCGGSRTMLCFQGRGGDMRGNIPIDSVAPPESHRGCGSIAF